MWIALLRHGVCQGAAHTEYCDRQRLGIPERLNLFGQVCDAVHHAHQKGIIHRDLKPCNILVAVDGIRFDLPTVAERSHAIISDLGLSERCRIVGGDFFASVPPADAYVLRHILHDWDDDAAATILANCLKALKPGGRVLLVETVIPPMSQPCFGKWLDLMMLIVGGRERTKEQYRGLFSRAGLTLNRIVPTAHEVSVIEGVRPA